MYCIVYGVAKSQTWPGDFYFQLKPNLTMTQNQYSSHIHFYLGPSPQIFSCLHCYLNAISLWRCNKIKKKERKWRCSVISDSSWLHGLETIRLLSPWNFPGKSTGVGCHFLFHQIFPNQGSNPGLLHCRQMLYRLSHQGSSLHFSSTFYLKIIVQFSSVQSLSRVRLFVTPWIAAHQASCPSSTPGVHSDSRPSS